MNLIEWSRLDSGCLHELAKNLSKSYYTVRSYAYGHRKTPLKVGDKIFKLTGEKVTQQDLDAKYREFQTKCEKVGLVFIKGGRLSSPILSLPPDSSQAKKKAFIDEVKTILNGEYVRSSYQI